MRTSQRLLIPLLVGVVLGTGCSLLVNFDPEGQKCDEQSRCLAGYGCVAGRCLEGVDAGTSVCGNCGAGQKCLESTRSCVPNTCQYTRCAVGSICNEDNGTPNCRPVQSPALGHPCSEDVDCSSGGANRFCFRGAIPIDNAQGTLRTGVCVERCPQFGGSCLTQGATCRDFNLGLDAGATRLCVPDNLLSGCRNDFDCVDPAYVCTVFDNPALGPATICDVALGSGAQPQAPCTSSKADGGTNSYCANGLCIPQLPGQAQSCGVACNAGTCPTSQVCALTEFTVRGTPRQVPMCVPAATRCNACASDAACNADAPRCTPFGLNTFCLAACSNAPGTVAACPSGQSCQSLDAGFRCVPTAGACP